MHSHEIRLRAPAFLGGGDAPVVVRRTDQRFVDGLFLDLKSEEGREHLITQIVPQQGEDEPVLYLPIHRCYNVVLAEAYCLEPGKPRVDPGKIESAGVVVRRRIRSNNGTFGPAERWLSEHGRARGWLVQDERTAIDDPLAKRRPLLSAGNAQVDGALALRRELSQRGTPGPYDESVIDLFVAPPDVCAALGTTLLFGVVDAADPVVAEKPRPRNGRAVDLSPANGYSSAQIRSLVPLWLRARSAPPEVPSDLAGKRFRVADVGGTGVLELEVQRDDDGWQKFDVPAPWAPPPTNEVADPSSVSTGRSATERFMRMLWRVRIEMQTFSGKPSAQALLQALRSIDVQLPDDEHTDLATLLEKASDVFVMLEEGVTVQMPEQWPAISGASFDQIIEGARTSLDAQLERFARSQGRYDHERGRYEVRAFARVDRDDGCPPRLWWSEETCLFRVAKWFEGGPDDAMLPTIELPTLDRGFLKRLKPNITVKVPRSMFNFLNNNKPEDLVAGKAKNDTRGPALAWFCGFNISIIFVIAFMLLISFVFLLNIAFWWVAFFKICIPLPVGSTAEQE